MAYDALGVRDRLSNRDYEMGGEVDRNSDGGGR